MYPVLFQIGPITIYSYGVMMALGFLAANWVVGKTLAAQGKDPNFSSTLVLWAAIGGLVGARLLFILDNWIAFLDNPIALIFTGAGFVWYGGLIGGVVGVTLCIWRAGFSWFEVMDAVAPGIALGHGIGRIGCHLAGDGDWGPPTSLPWGVAYTKAIVGWDYPPGVRVHPSALYETLAYVLIFVFLWKRQSTTQVVGTQFWWYLLLSGVARLGIEFVRINPALALNLSEAQWISLGLIGIGAVMLRKEHLNKRPAVVRSGQSHVVEDRR